MKKLFLTLLICFSCVFIAFAGGKKETVSASETIEFTDDSGRTVTLPKNITKVAPSGNISTVFLAIIAPEYMTNINAKMSKEAMEYLPAILNTLPVTGQLYGGKSTINTEELISLGAEVLIDIGDYKKGIEDDLNALQEQIGIPCIFLEGSLDKMGETFEKLGTILKGKKQRTDELKAFIEKTLKMAEENSAKIKDSERVSVMFSGEKDGLGTNPKGSSQAQVLEITGCINAIEVEKPNSKGNGNRINLEQLYNFNPDIILITEDSGFYKNIPSDTEWQNLSAVKAGKYYEIPCYPYCWLGAPPSINMVLGIWYLGHLVYPQYFNYDMNEVANQIYALFWGSECKYRF